MSDSLTAERLERKLFDAGCRVARLDAERYGPACAAVAAALLETGSLLVCWTSDPTILEALHSVSEVIQLQSQALKEPEEKSPRTAAV